MSLTPAKEVLISGEIFPKESVSHGSPEKL